MGETNQKKVINLSLNDSYVDKIIAQLQEMKTNKNKIIKITDPGNTITLVINHVGMDEPEAKTSKK